MGINQRSVKEYLEEHDVINQCYTIKVLVRFGFTHRNELGVFLFLDIVST